ncbi:NAD(P)-dependent oxidoreductase [Jiella sonneratiae]|uniref:NAD(P)-dependent oxidoreductase n=1 Tax=Jiella sonneratiae TaxID=2816856 RepID=A0ABS3J6N5_9HYPH|nr:NAD(P)-dependent oxidoreductase [Jiella sonneratiae]MBO0905324.1 NAD(P)-dependent oxidoreductase [Jiella sonneratiae]
MPTIAFLGLGAMGSRIARNILASGGDLVVWNRNPEKTEPYVAAGARAASSPRQAGEMADIVLAMVSNDEASREVWLDEETGALAGMAAGKTAIEVSTLTPDFVRSLGSAMAEKGVDLVEAPVSGTLPQAENAGLVFFLAGKTDALDRAEAVLKPLGKSLERVGDWGDAATVKLATNAILGVNVAAWAEVVAMLDRSQADTQTAVDAIAKTAVWAPNFAYLTSSMIKSDFDPKFPVELLDKDFRYALGLTGKGEAPMIEKAHETFERAIAEGLGAENMTAVAKLYR